jgi:hypothetical protein
MLQMNTWERKAMVKVEIWEGSLSLKTSSMDILGRGMAQRTKVRGKMMMRFKIRVKMRI